MTSQMTGKFSGSIVSKKFAITLLATAACSLLPAFVPALPAQQVSTQAAAPTQPGPAPPPPDQQQKKKKGFFGRLFGGKGDNDNKQQQDSSQPH